MKQISFERYIWMIAKTEIANDSKIRLRFENLTGKKTIRKFIIVDKFCNRYFLIFGTTQQHEAPKNFKLFTILQRKYARYFYPYLLNKNALQIQKSL